MPPVPGRSAIIDAGRGPLKTPPLRAGFRPDIRANILVVFCKKNLKIASAYPLGTQTMSTRPSTPSGDDDAFPDAGLMDADFLDLDEDPELDDEPPEAPGAPPVERRQPAWRLIERYREERQLSESLEDFWF